MAIRRLKAQYPMVAHNYHHILKSLVYFNDADGDPDPDICFDAKWSAVKRYFRDEIPVIAYKLMR